MENPTVLGNKRVHYFDIHDCSLQLVAVPDPGPSCLASDFLTRAGAIDGHPVSSTKHVSNNLMENEYSQPLYKFTVGLISGRGIGQQGAKVELPEMKTNMAAWDMPWHAKQNMHTVTLLGQNILKLYPLLEIRHQGLRVIIHSDSWLFRSSTPGFSFPWVSTKKSLGGLTLAAEKPAWDDGVSVSFVMLIHSGGAKIYKAIWFIVSPMKWGKIILKTPFVGWLEMPEIHMNGCWWWGLFHCLTPMTPMSAKINLDTSPSHSCSTRISMIAFPATPVGEISKYHTVPQCFCLGKKLITARCQNL